MVVAAVGPSAAGEPVEVVVAEALGQAGLPVVDDRREIAIVIGFIAAGGGGRGVIERLAVEHISAAVVAGRQKGAVSRHVAGLETRIQREIFGGAVAKGRRGKRPGGEVAWKRRGIASRTAEVYLA